MAKGWNTSVWSNIACFAARRFHECTVKLALDDVRGWTEACDTFNVDQTCKPVTFSAVGVGKG